MIDQEFSLKRSGQVVEFVIQFAKRSEPEDNGEKGGRVWRQRIEGKEA